MNIDPSNYGTVDADGTIEIISNVPGEVFRFSVYDDAGVPHPEAKRKGGGLTSRGGRIPYETRG